MESTLFSTYKKAIGASLNAPPEQVFLYWKGRVGLYAILKAMNIEKGDEVIIPAYTCVVVPNAIIYCGAKPVYVDIDPNTFNMDPAKVEKAISSATKLIIIQNTFGLSSDFDAIETIARHHDLQIIEDNTHGFGSSYKDTPCGLLGEASFFSSQWNKPFSTGVGGFVVAKNPDLIIKLQELDRTLKHPSVITSRLLQLQILFRKMLANSSLYWTAVNSYRWLSNKNIITGSSSGGELSGTEMPANYWMGASIVQAAEGLRQVEKFGENLWHRSELAKFYKTSFNSLGLDPPFEPDYARHIFLKFPFFVINRPEFLELAAKERIQLGEWLSSPIHPVTTNWEIWGYQKGSCPIAEKISAHILNLPTDPDVSIDQARQIINFLERHRHLLVRSVDELFKLGDQGN